jgi:tetratricopeptide (TPR) repeat protein
VLPVALLALTLTAPGQVSADAAHEAQTLAHRSALEYDLGHAEDALRDIERAYLLDPLPGLLFNLAQCHRKLEHWKQAEEAYRNFLHHRPNAPNRETVLELIEEMKREQATAAIPELAAPRPLPAPLPPRPEPRSPLPPESMVAPPAPVAPVAAAPPQPVPPPTPVEAPVEATQASTEAQPAPSKATAWPWVFAATAAVSAGFSIVGFAQMVSYSSLQSSSSRLNPTPVTAALSAEQNYTWGEPAGIAGAVLAALSVGGLALTW